MTQGVSVTPKTLRHVFVANRNVVVLLHLLLENTPIGESRFSMCAVETLVAGTIIVHSMNAMDVDAELAETSQTRSFTVDPDRNPIRVNLMYHLRWG